MLLRIMLRWNSCLKMIKANKPEPEDATHDKVQDHGDLSRKNPFDNVSLSDEESTDAKKQLHDIDNKFEEARLAKLKCSQ